MRNLRLLYTTHQFVAVVPNILFVPIIHIAQLRWLDLELVRRAALVYLHAQNVSLIGLLRQQVILLGLNIDLSRARHLLHLYLHLRPYWKGPSRLNLLLLGCQAGGS